jgi:membrane fusion protein (multidrug efflux system)
MAQTDQLHAQLARDQANLDSALEDYHRRLALIGDGGVSKEELSHARDTITALSATVDAARAAYEANEAQIAGTTVATHPTVLAAAARLRDAALALHRTEITAPVDGVVAKRSVEIGQRVDAGTPLMSIIPLNDVWIDANFKEVQLKHLRIGQPVAVHADVYGGDLLYHGRVAGVAAGSGSTFALLPAQNASGNWIKIVQRLPVRILLDPAELRAHPLRLGLSTVVDVDVTQTDNLSPTPIRNFPWPTRASAGADPSVSALINRIIDENGGTPAEVARDPAP